MSILLKEKTQKQRKKQNNIKALHNSSKTISKQNRINRKHFSELRSCVVLIVSLTKSEERI